MSDFTVWQEERRRVLCQIHSPWPPNEEDDEVSSIHKPALSFDDYMRKLRDTVSENDRDGIDSRAEECVTGSAPTSSLIITERGQRQRAKSVDELSRVDLVRRRRATDVVADRLRSEEERQATFSPRLAMPAKHSVLSKDLGRRRHRHDMRRLAQSDDTPSFKPKVRPCPDWLVAMASAHRVQKSLRTPDEPKYSSKPAWRY